MLKFLFLLIAIAHVCSALPPLKVLHLTFHKGCEREFEEVAKELGLQLETLFIPSLPPYAFDGKSRGNALYNIGHERAENIWLLHKEYFESFDLVITSDTAPLARIFLQNGFQKPLIIWICNRFDYYDGASLDCDFPDKEYYRLLKEAGSNPFVKFVAYTEFEHFWAQLKGIDTGSLTITPSGINTHPAGPSAIPSSIDKKTCFFLPPYHNETKYMDLSAFLKKRGIPNYCGRYNGPADLKDFKAIIHLPYTISNLALFENIQLGIPTFIPTKRFYRELSSKGNYFHPHPNYFEHSEWYQPRFKNLFVYFDSWDDLGRKIRTLDYEAKRAEVRRFGEELKQEVLEKWERLFEELSAYCY